jgi:hypothetical protein
VSVEDPGQASGLLQGVHIAWTTLLSAFTALIFWNWKRSYKELDSKALQKDLDEHKESVDKRFEAVQNELHRMIDAQGKQHEQNSTRLDTILLEISRSRGGRSQ